MHSSRALRAAVQAGEISIDELAPDAFEDLVVEIVRTEYDSFDESASISRDRRYDVDIVIREHKRGPFHTNDELHFIEAKCYGKNLSLDTTAKAYCAAIRYRPRTLTIACKSTLQPQPLDYGRALFGDGRVTRLFILNLRRALSLDALDPVLGETTDDVRMPLFSLRSWQIWKRTTFTAELTATSESAPPLVIADNEAVYNLVVIADRFDSNSIPAFHLSGEGDMRVYSKEIESFGQIVRINLPLTIDMITCGFTELVAVEGGRLTSETIRLPQFQVERPRLILPDIRPGVSKDWGSRLSISDGPRVLLLHGDGGVGKTYLCERIAASLHEKTGIRCAHISVDSATSHLTFLRLILSILFPADIDRSEGLLFEQEAVQSLFRSAVEDPNSDSPEVSNSHTDLHAQITLAAKLLATRSASVAIFLSNCQYLTPELTLGLRAFLSALDQFGWNQCRIVCEYRDQSGTTHTHLNEFVEAVLTNRIGNAAIFAVEGVDTITIQKVVGGLFPGAESHLVAASLMEKTAGNPFLLENLLQHYRDKGIIATTDTTGYKILDHARFHGIESQVSESAQHLLAERLKYLDSVLEGETGEKSLASRILGLAALMGNRVDERVWLVAGCDGTESRRIQKMFESHAILTTNLDDGSRRFSHDLMRAACRERLAKLPSGVRMVESALTRLSGEEPSDFELRGELHAFLRNEPEAMNEFNRGYELAFHGNQDFSMQKRCLIGMTKLYSRRLILNGHDRLMYVDVLSNLGWAEHNSGSSLHAAEVYHRALDLVEQTGFDPETLTPSVAWERKSALTHALLGLSLQTLQLDQVADWSRYAISSAQDFTRLGKILNRLVRLSSLLGYREVGHEAARLALSLAPLSVDPEVLAVLCTDIGDLYLHSEPNASKLLRDRGKLEARKRRQQLHNETCAAISDVYALSKWASEERISRIGSDARSVGVRNVSARLSIYRGAKACAEGALDLGRLYFLEASQIALLSGDLWLEALANNNLAIVSWCEGDENRANAEANCVLHTVERIVEDMPTERAFTDLVELARIRAESLRAELPILSRGNELPLLSRRIACCGTLNVLLRNLAVFGNAEVVPSISRLWANRKITINSGLAVLGSDDHPLVVHSGQRTLIFAVE